MEKLPTTKRIYLNSARCKLETSELAMVNDIWSDHGFIGLYVKWIFYFLQWVYWEVAPSCIKDHLLIPLLRTYDKEMAQKLEFFMEILTGTAVLLSKTVSMRCMPCAFQAMPYHYSPVRPEFPQLPP